MDITEGPLELQRDYMRDEGKGEEVKDCPGLSEENTKIASTQLRQSQYQDGLCLHLLLLFSPLLPHIY